MFGWFGEARRLRDKVESQAETIRELRMLADKLGRERDAAIEKFEIAHESLTEARGRLRVADARLMNRRLRAERFPEAAT